MAGHPHTLTIAADVTEFDMRVLVDRCLVEAFMLGGRAVMTSMGPTECRTKGCKTTAPGTAMLLVAHTDVVVRSLEVHTVGCGWTDPPYKGDGPFSVEGRVVPKTL